MNIFDYTTSEVVTVSEAQYAFLEAVIKASGRLDEVLKDYKLASKEQIDTWLTDPVFKQTLDGWVTVLVRSRGLTPEYVKSTILQTLTGKRDLTKAEGMALNASIRALGMGLGKTTLKAEVTPSNTVFTFEDGIDTPPQKE